MADGVVRKLEGGVMELRLGRPTRKNALTAAMCRASRYATMPCEGADAYPPAALAATRALIRGDGAAVTARIDEEAELSGRLIQSAEAREAFTAFLEKRAPDFRNAGV